MYKAIKEIGGYGIGDIVPDEKARLWLEMYDKPHVEEVKDSIEVEKSKEDFEEKTKVKESESLNEILDDYLGRNQSVVKKNLLEDKFSEHQLKELLKLEEADKRRPLIIKTIKERLKN